MSSSVNPSADSIITLVKQMRDAQRLYFRYRTHDELKQAQHLEREVDQAIRDYQGRQQQNLF